MVERVDKHARRISLSKLTMQEFEEYQAAVAGGESGGEPLRSVKPGSRIKVKVVRAEGRGLVVRVQPGCSASARAATSPRASSRRRPRRDLRKSYPQGSEIEVKVVGIDRDGGCAARPRRCEVDEERRAVKDYRREAGKQGFGTFGDLLARSSWRASRRTKWAHSSGRRFVAGKCELLAGRSSAPRLA